MTTPLNLEKMGGSLVLVSVELKHAGTYTFTVSNSVGSVEGCTKLMVHWFVYSVPSQSQSPTQDQYIHDAVLESLTCGDSQIPDSGLSSAQELKLKIEGQIKYTHVLCPQNAYLCIFSEVPSVSVL